MYVLWRLELELANQKSGMETHRNELFPWQLQLPLQWKVKALPSWVHQR